MSRGFSGFGALEQTPASGMACGWGSGVGRGDERCTVMDPRVKEPRTKFVVFLGRASTVDRDVLY